MKALCSSGRVFEVLAWVGLRDQRVRGVRLFVCDLVGLKGNPCVFDALHMTLSYPRSTYASV